MSTAPLVIDPAVISEQEADYRKLIVDVNDVLIERGRLVAFNYVPHEAAVKLRRITAAIQATSDAALRDTLFAEANTVMTQYCFHPGYRAFMVHRATMLPYISEVAHIIEQATLHYYRQDYLSATLLLAPAVENLMLRHIGYDVSHPSIGSKDLRALIASKKSSVADLRFAQRFPLFQHYVLRFINERYLENTKNAPLAESHLNRHYMLHGLGNETFYTFADCQTLFQYFDMYLEMLACEAEPNLEAVKWGLVPESLGDIPERTVTYWNLILERYLFGIPKHEEALLKAHPSFARDPIETNYIAVQRGVSELVMLTQGLHRVIVGKRVEFRGDPADARPERAALLEKAMNGVALMVSSKAPGP